ncbi:MAG: phosphoesterase [Candidatus Syntrophoarchaeum caldarius]|uniref:DNA polymerase beta n=1 Tax=Candidatus Syntropharchaeum caldarium TaxID=1838285 RepID=A0A1F2P8J4_9EURY|nr:MAG: phosphoesterase [Candidatus Syntrophoarchaeum caldarius]
MRIFMVMENREIAKIFDEIADILEVKNEDKFKIKAYRRAAQTIKNLTEDLSNFKSIKELKTLPGIGDALAKKIYEIIRTDKLEYYEKLKHSVPEGILELLAIPGIGPKTVAKLYTECGITDIESLERAAAEHKLQKLYGMGAKSEEKILKGIEQYRRHQERVSLGIAYYKAQEIIKSLEKLDAIESITYAGSLRRMKETIGDIDILVASHTPEKVMDAFQALDGISEVIARGDTKSSVIMDDLQVDLRVVEPGSFGSALQYFTGSKHHNIKLRELAIKKGLKLNEYGVFENDRKIAGEREEDVYRSLGLAFIPPELREDQGEIEAAIDGTLPDLIKHEDIRGDLHIHSTWSDGRNSIQEMVDKARSLGYCYIAICDHSPAVGVVHGVDEVKLLDEMDEIDRINDSLTDFKVLKGIEVDIRSDGKLDLPDKALEPLDIVVAAVHTGLSQSKEEMTARIISAIENPNVDVIAHPTGRIIGKRDPCDLDIEAIVDACIDYETILEINANPRRLDLNDTHARYARNRGAKLAISTDAHDTSQMDLMHFGVATARRGWLLKEDVVNTELVYVN